MQCLYQSQSGHFVRRYCLKKIKLYCLSFEALIKQREVSWSSGKALALDAEDLLMEIR